MLAYMDVKICLDACKWLVGWLVGLYGISTIVGYLMLNPVHIYIYIYIFIKYT